jgi:hypothetical protein
MRWGERRSACQRLRIAARVRYSMAKLALEDGDPSPYGLLYDRERDLFRFPGGRFAFSERHIDVDELVRRGMWEGPTPKELARTVGRAPELGLSG